MAIGMSNSRKASSLDAALGNGTPATVYVALVTDANTDIQRANGTFTEVTTTNWTNYGRVAVTNNAANWPAATTNTATSTVTKANGAIIRFAAGNAAITGTGPTPTGFVVLDSATLGAAANVIASGPITGTAVTNGQDVYFAVGAMTLSLA